MMSADIGSTQIQPIHAANMPHEQGGSTPVDDGGRGAPTGSRQQERRRRHAAAAPHAPGRAAEEPYQIPPAVADTHRAASLQPNEQYVPYRGIFLPVKTLPKPRSNRTTYRTRS